MRKLTEILRLRYEARLSHRQIARSLHVGLGTVGLYLRRFEAAGLSWPLEDEMDAGALQSKLFPEGIAPRQLGHAEPDFAELHHQLKAKGMTRRLLWEEYRERHGQTGYSYSQFCQRYKDWRARQRRSMRQLHKGGEKLFVDYAGQTVAVIDPNTGEACQAQIFVAVLGASNYTFAEATWSQGLADWLGSHVRAFEFFEGVTALVVPDNLKSAVSRACRYDPDLNPSYAYLASYYHTAVLPARPYKPKDKAKVEVGVQLVERWILARLRAQQFFSLAELNAAIRALLEVLNNRPFNALPGSRRTLFEAVDKPALQPLPARPYEVTEIKFARVHVDYHIEFDKHYYSVPHTLVRAQVEVRASASMLTLVHKHKVVACHARSYRPGGFTTCPEHMPTGHRKHHQWTPGRLLNWAQQCGPAVLAFTQQLLERRAHIEQGYRACLGLLQLSRSYGPQRLNAACARALHYKAYRLKSVQSILKQGLEQLPLEGSSLDHDTPAEACAHENLRGAQYYH